MVNHVSVEIFPKIFFNNREKIKSFSDKEILGDFFAKKTTLKG